MHTISTHPVRGFYEVRYLDDEEHRFSVWIDTKQDALNYAHEMVMNEVCWVEVYSPAKELIMRGETM